MVPPPPDASHPDRPESEPEPATLLDVLREALDALGVTGCVERGDGEGEDELRLDSGLILRPELVSDRTVPDGSARTTTVITARHPELFPDGVFEYQHSFGDTQWDSLLAGFKGWGGMDRMALEDALRETSTDCTTMEMGFPAAEGAGEPASRHRRRIVLGPATHYQEHPPEENAGGGAETGEEEGDGHTFCPCCLFTNSLDAFMELLQGRDFLGVRLFAARDADGETSADCRVNGEDFAPALPLLKAYAAGWPAAGTEYRKQYVVIHTEPTPEPAH